VIANTYKGDNGTDAITLGINAVFMQVHWKDHNAYFLLACLFVCLMVLNSTFNNTFFFVQKTTTKECTCGTPDYLDETRQNCYPTNRCNYFGHQCCFYAGTMYIVY
jgi:hypothetical protein